ncbi:MAG TPA: phosphoribosylformylglycinamidine synthase subunit PurS [Dictyoglomaceae bacterium]|nr:phosphoribosylformylglycinamidine synthase subunit PurS [Dictyoglomaceae bacterium]HOL39652.1 phosphoribosylformylglycinamidine synthase subunit PurS [Dictyoglomaceae bacterium]HPP15224.1 phosphoribosylformylglycinamidine synthase subunit PurS [Dictyoglomaceae bacterium]
MRRWNVILEIFLRDGIFDPQGKTIKNALYNLDFKEVEDVRFGKVLKIVLYGETKEDVEEKVRKMSEIFLANPVTEDFKIRVEE